MNALEIVMVSVGGYGAGWAGSTYMFVKVQIAKRGEAALRDGETMFFCGMGGMVWPFTIIPQIGVEIARARLLGNPRKPKPAKLSRRERKLVEKEARKRAEAQRIAQITQQIKELDAAIEGTPVP